MKTKKKYTTQHRNINRLAARIPPQTICDIEKRVIRTANIQSPST